MHMMIEGGKISRTLDVHKHLTQEIKIVFRNALLSEGEGSP